MLSDFGTEYLLTNKYVMKVEVELKKVRGRS